MKAFEAGEVVKLMAEGYVVADTRNPALFCDGAIDGSVSIPFNDTFHDTLPEVMGSDVKVILVADEAELNAVLKSIKASAITNVVGYLNGGFDAWKDAGNKVDLIIAIEADEFHMDYQFDEFYLLDVRSKEEYSKDHVEAAENIALIDLEPMLVDMDTQEIYYVYGNTGADAVTAASLFKKNGFQRVRPIASDLDTIKTCGVPYFKEKKKKDA